MCAYCMYVCIIFCMYVYMYVCMYVSMYTCVCVLYVRMYHLLYYVYMYICMYVMLCMYITGSPISNMLISPRNFKPSGNTFLNYETMYINMHTYIHTYIHTFINKPGATHKQACQGFLNIHRIVPYMYVYMYVCIYVCIYVCMHVKMYACIMYVCMANLIFAVRWSGRASHICSGPWPGEASLLPHPLRTAFLSVHFRPFPPTFK